MKNEWNLLSLVSENKRTGKVWRVENKKDPTQVGYFKHATSSSVKFTGPLAANEYLSYLIGKELSLPMAETILAEIDGIDGIVSLEKVQNKELYNWNRIKNYSHPYTSILDSKLLIKMFVFDVLVANIDRNNRNIILYKADKKEMYDYYLIDHGLTLFGSFIWKGKPWYSAYWNNVYNYNRRYLKGLPSFILSNQTILNSYIQEVQKLSNGRIEEIIEKLPSNLLAASKKVQLKDFSIQRKSNIPQIIHRWQEDFQNKSKN